MAEAKCMQDIQDYIKKTGFSKKDHDRYGCTIGEAKTLLDCSDLTSSIANAFEYGFAKG